MQAGGIEDEDEEERSQNEDLEGAGAGDGSETTRGIAAVEGLLSSLALSESAAEVPAVPSSARQAAAGGEVEEPDPAAEPAASAADDSMLHPAKAAGAAQALTLAQDAQRAEEAVGARADDEKVPVEGVTNHSPATFAADLALMYMLQLLHPCLNSSLTSMKRIGGLGLV